MNADKIAQVIQQQLSELFTDISDKTFMRGEVVGISGRMVEVLVEGNDYSLPGVVCLASYHPNYGDKVLLVSIGRTGTNFIALNKIDDTGLVINLIENPSMEVDAVGWTTTAGTGARTADATLGLGSYVYKQTRTAGGSRSVFTTGNLIAGQDYNFLFFSKGEAGATVKLYHDGVLIYTYNVSVGWAGFVLSFTAFENVPLEVEIVAGPTVGNSVTIDAMSMTESNNFYEYFDGDFSVDGNFTQWDGVPHKSTSRSFVTNDNNLWFVPFLQNGWIRYDTTWSNAGYMRDHNGFIHLRGLVKSGTVGSTMFQLPLGHRPAQQLLISTISNGAVGRIRVQTNGVVAAESPSSNVWVALDGITFKADDSGL